MWKWLTIIGGVLLLILFIASMIFKDFNGQWTFKKRWKEIRSNPKKKKWNKK